MKTQVDMKLAVFFSEDETYSYKFSEIVSVLKTVFFPFFEEIDGILGSLIFDYKKQIFE